MKELNVNIRYSGPAPDPNRVARVCASALVATRPLELKVEDAICRVGTPVMGDIGSYPERV